MTDYGLILDFNSIKAEKKAKIQYILNEIGVLRPSYGCSNLLATMISTPGAPLANGVSYNEDNQTLVININANSIDNINIKDIKKRLNAIEGISHHNAGTPNFYGFRSSSIIKIDDCKLQYDNHNLSIENLHRMPKSK